jgi:Asp-tRNA(Asn)/Glu-tRNA(Gln) amidotransferase A subunit family amidase
MGKLAFYSVSELAYLIKNRQITSLELTQLFLSRLKKYGDTLQCTITLTDSLALSQAQRADVEIKQGIYRGPLHGIPYGAKDLLNVAGYKTTWGATPFKSQVFSKNAEIINRLEAAGAVLVAKLTLGALAWGDVWYGGKTRNPWDLEQGSSGSSAGSASATVAGLVPFAIGSETLGSIVSPSTRCGATGLRPTFGRISNDGAMALSWTMDKLGPICRNALDCALVFEVIRGTDGKDLSVRDAPFNYHYNKEIKNLHIGVLTDDQNPDFYSENDQNTLLLLKSKGYDLVEKTLPENIPIEALSFILEAEAAAAFNFLTQSNQDDLMVRQTDNAWPNIFRAAQLIPAVAYIQANRLRYELTLQFNELMSDIDILMVPSFSNQLLITNLTGHPCVVIPNGSYADENPGSITLLGNHFDEASILSLARFLQEITPYNKEHPDLFKP